MEDKTYYYEFTTTEIIVTVGSVKKTFARSDKAAARAFCNELKRAGVQYTTRPSLLARIG